MITTNTEVDRKTDVLIVGAGPTGLTLACDLARRGVDFLILDKAESYFTGSRAKGTQPRTLEVFDDLGIVEHLLESGVIHLPIAYYARGTVLREEDPYQELSPRPDVPYEGRLVIPQWRVEEILRERLAEFAREVELYSEVVDLTQNDSTVSVTVLVDGARTVHIAARYVVGCDGGHSTIRKALGVGFEGETRENQVSFVGDVQVDGLRDDRLHLWMDPAKGVVAITPFKCGTAWAFQAPALPDAEGHYPEPTIENFRHIFYEVTGMTDVSLHQPTWLSMWRVNVRMVDRFHVGRCFLAGDAAHIHTPNGGLGMNTGVQDAYNLGWKLALVLSGRSDEALLTTYEEERLPMAEWAIKTSTRLGEAFRHQVQLGSTGTAGVITPEETLQLLLGYRWSSLAEAAITRGDGSITAGDRAPDAPCRGASGESIRLFDIFRGPHFTLLGFGESTAAVLSSVERRFPTLVHTCLVDAESQSLTSLRDADSHARLAYAAVGALLVLVRPDGYIGFVGAGSDGDRLIDYLNRIVPQAA